MSWNYRVIRKTAPEGEYCYRIHEVYYNNQGDAEGWSVEPYYPDGDTLSDLVWSLDAMKKAAIKPILEVFEGKLVEVE